MSVLFVGLTKGTFYCQIAIVILCTHFLYTQKSRSQLYERLVFTVVFSQDLFYLVTNEVRIISYNVKNYEENSSSHREKHSH